MASSFMLPDQTQRSLTFGLQAAQYIKDAMEAMEDDDDDEDDDEDMA